MQIRRIVLMAALLGAAPALGSTWDIDSSHSGAQFGVRHLMVSTVRGSMGKISGVVLLDEQDLTKSKVDAVIDVAGINTGDAKRDEHLRAPDFFDVAKFPTIIFKSTSVAEAGPGKYKVTGDLTMRGTTKSVVLDLEGSPKAITDPYGNQKIGGVAKTKINRQDFGISFSKTLDAGGLAVGNEVDITVDIELTQRK